MGRPDAHTYTAASMSSLPRLSLADCRQIWQSLCLEHHLMPWISVMSDCLDPRHQGSQVCVVGSVHLLFLRSVSIAYWE